MFHLNDRGPDETIMYAARILKATPHQILSIKIRENVYPYSDYQQLFDEVSKMRLRPRDGDCERHVDVAMVVMDRDESCVLVKHESGFEILQAVDSAASIGSFVISIIALWLSIRKQSNPNSHATIKEIEFRRLAQNRNDIDGSIETTKYPVDEILRKQIDFNKYS